MPGAACKNKRSIRLNAPTTEGRDTHARCCNRCDESSCLECTDPLLLSIRRSGARKGDPPLPFDELERELPHALEFGTKDPRFFASAEAFDVVRSAKRRYPELALSFKIDAKLVVFNSFIANIATNVFAN